MRSSWKGVFIAKGIYRGQKPFIQQNIKDKKIRIGSRNTSILSTMFQSTFSVYNGKGFFPLVIHTGMVGHKFGDFIFTKRTGNRIHVDKGRKKSK